jgi:acyl-CoA hydrolase
MNELVLPNDTNSFGNLMGGRLMYWMDIAAGIVAVRHSNTPCMTASVDNISFKNPIKLGNIVHIEAKVTRAFNTSMEIHLKVWGEDSLHQYQYESNEAYFTFVALDPNGKPRPVPALIPETEEEINLFEGALRRIQKNGDGAHPLACIFYFVQWHPLPALKFPQHLHDNPHTVEV